MMGFFAISESTSLVTAASKQPVGALAVVVMFFVLGRYWNWPGSRRKDMPPGPPPLPLLGNLLQMKPVDIYQNFRGLNEQYGPLASLKVGSSNVIVIGGDGTLVRQLLDKRGSIYSARPLEMALEVGCHGDHILFQQNADLWRTARKQIVQHYSPRTAKTDYVRVQEAESVQLLHDFLHKPEHFMHHPLRYTASVITCLNYGIRCETKDDTAVRGIDEVMTRLGKLIVPGLKPPVEDFPWLNYLPDFVSPWKIKSRELGECMEKLYTGHCFDPGLTLTILGLADVAWERGVGGLNTNTLSYKLRLGEGNTGLTRIQQAYIAGIVLEGGSDIVAGAILTCILALTHYNERQERARAEIDSLYDEDTLPKWDDEQKMPFVRAVIKEVLRWRPPIPMGVPHRLEEDDHFEGYFLPKNSTVVHNIWAIHSNPQRYEDPHLFKPERFLDHTMSMVESMAHADPLRRDHFAFGAGK